ncbi:MAG: DUF6020 family protein [Bacteroidales bacterium]|nr:DUF6020 family protein [Bacteroidales bacterium]
MNNWNVKRVIPYIIPSNIKTSEWLLLMFIMMAYMASPGLFDNILTSIHEGQKSLMIQELYYIGCRVLYALVLPAIYSLFKRRITNKRLVIHRIVSISISLFIAFACTIGYSFSLLGNWNLCFGNSTLFLIWNWQMASFSLSFYWCIMLLYYWFDEKYTNGPTELKSTIATKKWFMRFLLAFLPYWILLWPCVFQWDSFHLSYKYLEGNLDNHNPIIYQFFFGVLMQLGATIGNVEIVFSVLSLLQIVVFSISIIYITKYIQRTVEIDFLHIKYILVFYAIVPVYAISSMQVIKDFYFSIVILLYSFHMYSLVIADGVRWRNPKNIAIHFVLLVFLCLTKNQGVYIALLTGLFLCIYHIKHIIYIAPTYVIIVASYLFLFIGWLLPLYNVDQTTRKQESIGCLLQATARYVIENPDDVTEEEKNIIGKVLEYDKLACCYELECSDGIKGSSMRDGLFNRNSSDKELTDYYKVWLQMGLRHPSSYIQAFIGTSFVNFYYGQAYPEQYTPETGRVPSISQNPMREVSSTIVAHIVNRIPFIGKLMNTPTYDWLFVIIIGYFVSRKRFDLVIVSLPVILCLCILFVSPCGGFRYSEPIILCVPLFFCLAKGSDTPLKLETRKK